MILLIMTCILRFSAVRKEHETYLFHALGIFEILGSKISHGTLSQFADVRTHLRKIVNRKTKLDENLALFFLLTVNGLFFFI